ncbi:TIGR03085 family metal-binding protein [Knoellia koreensis]|nr:TIGR03085 family metal-binding protein [Knoellia sp. DB2414S]
MTPTGIMVGMFPLGTDMARTERQALADTLVAAGPDAPTLCDPWDTADLAAHLVIRERRPDLAPGIMVPALAGRLDEAMDEYAARPWPELVEDVRSGPPAWSPTRLGPVDEAVNLVEFVVHHEDVLRGDGSPGPRRTIGADLREALWTHLARFGRLYFRRSPVGVVLATPSGQRATVKGTTEAGTVVLEGEPEELLLAAYGRRRVAQVEETGGKEAVASLWAAPIGLA